MNKLRHESVTVRQCLVQARATLNPSKIMLDENNVAVTGTDFMLQLVSYPITVKLCSSDVLPKMVLQESGGSSLTCRWPELGLPHPGCWEGCRLARVRLLPVVAQDHRRRVGGTLHGNRPSQYTAAAPPRPDQFNSYYSALIVRSNRRAPSEFRVTSTCVHVKASMPDACSSPAVRHLLDVGMLTLRTLSRWLAAPDSISLISSRMAIMALQKRSSSPCKSDEAYRVSRGAGSSPGCEGP